MTWKKTEAIDHCGINIGRPQIAVAIKRAVAARGSYNLYDLKAATVGLGPLWSGCDSLYNPRHKQRWPVFIVGVALIVIHFMLESIFVSYLYNGLNAEDVDELTLKSLKFVFLPGAGALLYAGWFCRKYLMRRWQLEAAHNSLIYSRPLGPIHQFIAEFQNEAPAFLRPTVGRLLPEVSSGPSEKWRARIADVARVETSATADWEPARQGLLGDNAVSRDEVQAFLFMHDGSRRVIAKVHGGREDMAKLTHSIRSWLDGQRQPERLIEAKRVAVAAPDSADGFNI
jgi:hypothetical protein